MADYSKQWVEQNDPGGMNWDFDILEIASNLKPEHYTSIICEGYGFIAIAKDEHGAIHLALRNEEEGGIIWVDYNTLMEKE